MRKKKEKWSLNHNSHHFSSHFYIGQNHQGIQSCGKSWISLYASQQICPLHAPVLSGKKSEHLQTATSLILSLSLILPIPRLPLCTYLLWLSVAFSPLLPSSVLFSVWQLSGPTWPRLISVSYGSWRVRPSPLNTDWLAGLISSLRTLCSLPSSARCCAVRARPDTEECG